MKGEPKIILIGFVSLEDVSDDVSSSFCAVFHFLGML